MKCTCGGELQLNRRALPSLEPIPRHRKSRIQKKRFKQWLDRTNQQRMLLAITLSAMGPCRFQCVQCGRAEGFYSVMGRNMFTVTPMPMPVVFCENLEGLDDD